MVVLGEQSKLIFKKEEGKMETEAMFEKAGRDKLRFNYKGLCTVEDLWDLPVKALDSIYKELKTRLKQQEDSLLEEKNTIDKTVQIGIDIITYIVKNKLDEKKIREDTKIKAERKQKILGIIANKQDTALSEMSIDDLTKLVNEL